MRNRKCKYSRLKRLRYERLYREKNRKRLYLYRRQYERKNHKRIAKYREKYKILYQKNHPIKFARQARNLALKRNFGISLKEYVDILTQQKHRCLICATTKQQNGKDLAVDHDHSTGKVRGLLCSQCNVGLGYFKDNPSLLRKAVDYLAIKSI